ncbi:MAG TPA: GTP-binding protein [Casimicrobiaceae bacterium]|nr:GTP-binding protein [Casimicrobiaceae bacterium]
MTPARDGRDAIDPLASRLPVTILTGFLGAGKTTLLRRLIADPRMNRAAVIINEFGEVGLDHELVEARTEQLTLLSNGCLCCSVRTDLQETLRDLFVKRRAGDVIDFDRVFVETTGMADPAPILHALQSDSLLGAQYRLNGVVTLVDAVNGRDTLQRMPEAQKQVALADRLVVTKTDLASPENVSALRGALGALNPYATISNAVNGELDPDLLREIVPGTLEALSRDPDRWLAVDDPRTSVSARIASPTGVRHDTAIHSFCLWFDQPFEWNALVETLQMLTALRGPDLLRVKGIVDIEGEPGPVAIHGVQHLFHPPLKLSRWSSDDRRSRIVFIVRGIPQRAIESAFEAARALTAPD